ILHFKEATYIKLTNINCISHNTSWIHFHECRLKAISRNKTVLNLNGSLDYPVHAMILNLQMYKRANGWKPWLLKTSYDSCLGVKTLCTPLGKFIYNLYKNYSNINHTCPYVGFFLVQGFHVKAENFLLPFPTGQYYLDMHYVFGKMSAITIKVFFDFVENIIDM
ncbi:hypothetical protein KR215_011657, partial [Drosophila sulfurigaster]